ncbi:MAG: S8 family serine peptidase [Thermoguttaceae bacterium]|nr:S8 family serine peptidase [Thermoguttaceae bacterium]
MLSVTQPVELPAGLESDYSYTSYAKSGVMKYNSVVDDLIGLTEVQQEYGLSGSGQTVVIVDSGITADHAAFRSGQIVGGWDFAENDSNPSDDSTYGGHGTHLAGILAGSTTKYTGVAPGVDLVILRVFDDNGVGSFELIEQALQWIETNLNSFDNPITAVNLSVGSVSSNSNATDWKILDDELESLYNSGVFISVAAGNDYKDYPTAGVAYPACSQYTVSVGAVDGDGDIATYSQRDANTIFAPGYGIYSSVPDILGNNNNRSDDFTRMTGTSMATPVITGVSCLLREAYANMGYTSVTQKDIYSVMTTTADKVYDAATKQTYNRINVAKAVEYIYSLDAKTTTSSTTTQTNTQTNTNTSTNTNVNTNTSSNTKTNTNTNTSTNTNVQTNTNSNKSTNTTTQTNTKTSSNTNVSTNTNTNTSANTSAQTSSSKNLPDGVTVSGSKILFTGTSGADSLKVDASGSQWKFTFNGKTLTYSFSTINSVQSNLGAGADTFEFIASAGTDSIRCYQEYTLINGDKYVIKSFGAETTSIKADSADSVVFYDSAGEDSMELNLKTRSAMWTTGTNTWMASGMKEVNVSQTAGGRNSAIIYDSDDYDLFSVTENAFAYNGMSFRSYVIGLNDVVLKSVNGGNDAVRYTAGSSAATLTAQAGASTFKTNSVSYTASGFYYTYAYAGTGRCSATLKDSADASKPDYVIADVGQTKMYSSNYMTIVNGFQSVKAVSSDSSSSGVDSASLYGTNSAETVTATSSGTTLSDGSRSVTISNFASRRVGRLTDADRVAIHDAALQGYLADNANGKYSSSRYSLSFN